MRSNPTLIKLVAELKKKSSEEKIPLYRRLADDLEKRSREVNLCRLNRQTKEGDIVVVPGKVLGGGSISHKVTVAAYNFSGSSKKKIEESKGKCISISQLVQQGVTGKKVRIIG